MAGRTSVNHNASAACCWRLSVNVKRCPFSFNRRSMSQRRREATRGLGFTPILVSRAAHSLCKPMKIWVTRCGIIAILQTSHLLQSMGTKKAVFSLSKWTCLRQIYETVSSRVQLTPIVGRGLGLDPISNPNWSSYSYSLK